MHGFLNVCKEPGATSHDVVAAIRRLVPGTRVGHAGTLDPAAAGVLPIALGRATRLVDLASAGEKTYFAVARLGVVTDTEDAEGRVLDVRPVPSDLTREELARALGRFVGEIEQRPPAHSALKVGGRRAYELARVGQVPTLRPRRISIYAIDLLFWRPPDVGFVVRCSRGTYVRALARDLGESLGTGAHLGRLVRLAVGPFHIFESRTVEELRQAVAGPGIAVHLLPADFVLSDRPAVVVPAARRDDLASGRQWPARRAGAPPAGPVRVYDDQGAFLGVAEHVAGRWQPRLFVGAH